MKFKLLTIAFLITHLSVSAKEFVDYVNTLMGTNSTYEFSYGNTYPAVARPWAMNFWSPQTGPNRSGWMYAYGDTTIRGFRQTHQPSPWINDYATFSLMPVSGDLKVSHKDRRVSFKHENEVATPYLYKVKMDNKVDAQITSTDRGAVFKVAYPHKDKKYLIVDAYDGGSMLELAESNKKVTGYVKNNNGGVPDNFANYLTMEFNYPVVNSGVMINGELFPGKRKGEHNQIAMYLEFDIPEGKDLIVKVASSFISPEQAELNLQREIGDRSFDMVMEESKKIWNENLGRIVVEDPNEENKRVFYSCLYRTLLFPRSFYEFNAQDKPVYYSPYDGKIYDGYMFTDNGFWDTFRAVHPFFTIFYPELTEKIVQSLVDVYEQSGFFPEWMSPGHRGCMIGNNSVSLIADAWIKGITNFDQEKALEGMIKTTNSRGRETSVGRHGFEEYNKLGYVPYPNFSEATAKTLEYAYNDWCISRFAEGQGNKEVQADYQKKSMNYKNLFDPAYGFMRAKNAKGEWIEPFDPVEWGGPFTEGSSWHYTWSVFHDPLGLAKLMGGPEKMADKLDSMFVSAPDYKVGTYGFVIHEIAEMVALNMGQYAHGNQPVQHAIYLYNYTDRPWKAQYHLRDVMTKLYNSSPKGYCGDEDNGQTSAWYVFSAMGFYPVCPGQPEYVIGSPLFQKVTMKLPNGKEFVVKADKNSPENVYIQKAKLNNKNFENNFITHDQILNGGVLEFVMGKNPNMKRGLKKENRPYSFTKE